MCETLRFLQGSYAVTTRVHNQEIWQKALSEVMIAGISIGIQLQRQPRESFYHYHLVAGLGTASQLVRFSSLLQYIGRYQSALLCNLYSQLGHRHRTQDVEDADLALQLLENPLDRILMSAI